MDPQDETLEATLLGRTIGSYRIERRIGQGGMGEVFRARDLRLKRTVAVKSLRGERADNEIARQRFVREARLATRVAHPYIATVFDVVDDRGVLLLVMEYIRGDTLHRRLKDGPADPDTAIRWGLEIAEALQAVHEAGIVHRDLKPGNVMFAAGEHIKVTDFGVARITAPPVADDSVSPTWTESPGDFVTPGGGSGTVQYMSPEQVRGDAIDARSDLFSLGVILWEAVAGEHPFRRETRFETASAILSEEPGGGEIPAALDANPGLRDVVVRLTRKDPEERFATAAEVVAALQALARPPSPKPSPWNRIREHPWVLALCGVALVAAVWAAIESIPPEEAPEAPVQDVRPVIAVLPFDDPMAPEGAEFEAEMVAALLAADLSDSRAVRPIGSARAEEILAGLGPGAPIDARIEAVATATRVDWVLAGEMFRADGGYRAAAELYSVGTDTPVEAFRVDASRASGLVDRLVARVQSALGDSGAAQDRARVASDSDEANLLEYRARKAHRDLRLGEAIRLYGEAQRIDPRLVTAGIGEALARHTASEGIDAVNAIRDVIARIDRAGDDIPGTVRTLATATEARIVGDTAAEVESRAALVESFPDDPEYLEEYAESLRRAGRLDEARAAIDRALGLDEQDPRLVLVLAQILIDEGDTDACLAEVQRSRELFEAIASGAGVASSDLMLGHTRRYLAAYDEARQAYESADEGYTDEGLEMLAAIARSNVADMLLRTGRIEDAEKIYRETLAIAKAAGYATLVVQDLNALGGAYFGQGDLMHAETYLRQAVDEGTRLGNDSLLVSPVLNLAGVLGYANRTEESLELATQALALARSTDDRASESHARILLADAHYKQGDIAEAAGDYREVVRLEEAGAENSTKLIWGLVGVAEMLTAQGDLGEAYAGSRRAVDLSRDSEDPIVLGYPRIRHAWVLLALGRNDEAVLELDRVDEIAASTSPPLADLQMRSGLLRDIAVAASGQPGSIDALAATLEEISGTGYPQLSASGFAAAARLAAASGEPARAVGLARRALAVDRLGRPVRVEAEAALALGLAMNGAAAEAELAARTAQRDAEQIDARFSIAVAAAAIAMAGDRIDIPDADAAAERGRRALGAIEASIDPDHREGFRARSDVQLMMRWLGIGAGSVTTAG